MYVVVLINLYEVLEPRDCYAKSGSEYNGSSLVGVQASTQHSNLSLNSQNGKSIRKCMETKQACSSTSSDLFLVMLCCSGASWAKADAMIFNSFSFSFPGIYPVINNSIHLKLFFKKKMYAATVTLEMF